MAKPFLFAFCKTFGVKVVWLVFPKLKKVEVYHSLRHVTVCFDDDICSAAPVLPDFEIAVDVLLK